CSSDSNRSARDNNNCRPQGLRHETEEAVTMKARWIALSAAAAVALPLAGAGAAELRVGIHTDALTLDPANHRDRETETIIRNMYDGLLTRDAQMKVVPEL